RARNRSSRPPTRTTGLPSDPHRHAETDTRRVGQSEPQNTSATDRPRATGLGLSARVLVPAPKLRHRGRISPQIEHRLFSAITQNWRGKPLVSHEVVVNLIGATTTATGLK